VRKRAEGALDRACRESWTPEEAAGAHGAIAKNSMGKWTHGHETYM
jgi:hypothetical protein